jgi:DNA-binding winged helix-turn-helix (wHTH) protein
VFVYLARRRNQVVPHGRLLLAEWGPGWSDRREYLRVCIRRLRKKLEENPSRPRHLLTQSWVGYRFNPILQIGHVTISAISQGERGHALDPSNAEALWKKSEEMVGEVF